MSTLKNRIRTRSGEKKMIKSNGIPHDIACVVVEPFEIFEKNVNLQRCKYVLRILNVHYIIRTKLKGLNYKGQ